MIPDRTLFVILSSIFSLNVAFSVIAPFFPLEFKMKGVPTSYIGLTLSVYTLCCVIFSPLVGSALGKIGRRRALVIGLGVLSSSLFTYTLIELTHSTWFLVLAISIRCLQGVGATFLSVSACAVTTERYKDNLDLIMVLIKLTGGVGIVAGPSIGSAIYSMAGFKGPFILFAIVFLFIAIVVAFFTTDSLLNESPEDGPEARTLTHETSYESYGALSGSPTLELREAGRLMEA